MKKIRVLSVLVLVLFVFTSFASFAVQYNGVDYPEFSEGVGQILAKNNTPTLDGVINPAEGWSDAKAINSTNMNPFWGAHSICIVSGNIYFAWDAKNLYFAADISDPNLVLSTDEDESFETGENEYGWNGDVLTLGIDPLGRCYQIGMTGNGSENRTAWYNFGIGAGNEFKVYRTQTSDGELSSEVNGVAVQTTTGWAFEASIPWTTILDDAASVSYGEADISVDEVTVAGAISKAGIMYVDRAVASDATAQFNQGEGSVEVGEIFTISRNITVPVNLPDGTLGVMNGGESLRSYGIDLTIADPTGFAPETTTVETTTEAPETTKKADKKTEAKDDEKNVEDEDDEGGANVGLIVGIIVAVVVIAGVVVFFILKKNKKPTPPPYVAPTEDETEEVVEEVEEVVEEEVEEVEEVEETVDEEEEVEVDWFDLTPEQQKEYLDSLSPEERADFEAQIKAAEEGSEE